MFPQRNLHPRFQQHIARARRIRIIGGALLVTCLLIGTGAALTHTLLPQQLTETLKPIASIVSSKLSQLPSALSERIPNIELQLPTGQLAASATSFPQSVAEKIRNLFCRWLTCDSDTLVAQQPAYQQRATLPPNVKQPAPIPQTSPGDVARSATTSLVVSNSPASNASPSSTPAPHVIQQPVIERTNTVIQSGISEALLNEKLLALTNDLNSRMSQVAGARAYQAERTAENVADATRIEQLTNLTAHDLTVDGVSGLTDDDLPDRLTASNYLALSGGTLTGDLAISGTLSASTLSVAGISSGGAIEAPYFTATSSTATSTFAGPILALGPVQFANSSNFFGETKFGATGTTTIATDGTISTPSIIANSATASTLTAYSSTIGALTATSSLAVSGSFSLGSLTGWLNASNGIVSASTSPTVGSITATSSTATSTFAGGITGPGSFTVQSSSGRVGIGTASPSGRGLHISSATTENLSQLVLTNPTNGISQGEIFFDSSHASGVDFGVGHIAGASSFAIRDLTAVGSPVRFIITSAGDVGIGTTNPTYKLDVSGTGRFTGLVDAANFVATSTTATSTFASGIQVGLGSASNPSLSFISDPTSGFYRVTTGRLGLTLSGSQVADIRAAGFEILSGISVSRFNQGVTVGSSYSAATPPSQGLLVQGNVGIGTTTPGALLDVNGAGKFGTNYTRISNAALNVGDSSSRTTTSGSGTLAVENTSATPGDVASILFSTTESSVARRSQLSSGQDGNGSFFAIANRNNSAVYFEALRIDRNGNLGVGSTTPWAKLSITNTGTGPSFIVEDSTSPDTTPFIIDASGNVGIGTTGPGAKLAVAGDTAGAALVSIVNSVNRGITIRPASDGTGVGGAVFEALGPSAAFQFAGTVTPFVNMTYDLGSSGNNWATVYTHTVKGRNNSSNGDLNLRSGHASRPLTFGIDATEYMRVDSTGNVGVASSTPWRRLSVTGTVGFDGLTGSTGAGSLCLDANKQVVYNDASDSCLSSTRDTKHDIQPLTLNALGMIEGLEPVSFVYNEGNDRTRFGFIAEDTAAIDPHLATYNASGTVSGIDDRAILSLIVAAIKEFAAKIAGFAESFTTKELSFERGTGGSITLTRELCFADGANDTSPLCLTKSQVSALLSQSAGAAASISVPSSPPDIREPAPPESVTSTSTPDAIATSTTEAPAPEPENDEPLTEELSADAPPDAANDNDATTADQPGTTEPANDSPLPPDSLTGTE